MTATADDQWESTAPRWLFAFVIFHLLVWTVVPWLGQWRIPIDNLEQLDWVRHIDWGYPKHPPLPTWVLAIAAAVLPLGVPLTFGLGALCTGLMLWVTWRLCDELLGRRSAVVAVLLVCGITYYTSHVRYYNHNTLLMVAHALALLCVWRCASGSHRSWWWLLGLTWGVGMLSKYQMVLSIFCNICFLAVLARDPRHQSEIRGWVRGVLLAAGICFAMLVPHVLWLISHQFPTFDYASKSIAAHQDFAQRLTNILQFIGHHFGRALAMLAMTVVLLWLGRHRYAYMPVPSEAAQTPTARLLFVTHALVPFALMTLLALLGGAALQIHWGTAYLWLLAPWYLTTPPGNRLVQLPLSWVLAGLLIVQFCTLLQYAMR